MINVILVSWCQNVSSTRKRAGLIPILIQPGNVNFRFTALLSFPQFISSFENRKLCKK